MRLVLAAALLAASSLTPVFAADIAAVSKIDAVTIYPQGAEVTRVATATLEAGEHTLILKDLPGELDPQSIRVEGDSENDAAIEIASVDSKQTYVTSDAQDAERRRIETEIEELQDERYGLDMLITDIDTRKKLLLSLIDRQVKPPTTTDSAVTLDPALLVNLFELSGERMTALTRAIHEAQKRQRGIDRKITELSARLNEVAPQQQLATELRIFISAASATKGSFAVRYRVANAGWVPFYDARLASPAKDKQAQVEIVRRAQAVQSTGEVWDNVRLTLSTARSLGSTAAPDLWAEEIRVVPKEEPVPVAVADQETDAGAARDALEFAPKPEELTRTVKRKRVVQRQAEVTVEGFQALYAIPGRVTIDNSGTSKKVRIDSGSYAASLYAVSVPMTDPTAYLTAAFKLTGDAPLLPGTVNLYRDGVYMGQGTLDQLNPGEEAKLGFGADDLIKVKRAEVKRQSGEEGLITSSNVEERAFEIEIRNLHEAPLAVTVLDRIPFSTDEQVVVEPIADMTAPLERDLDKRRGVMAWRVELAAAETKTVKLGYKVTWPKEIKIRFSGE